MAGITSRGHECMPEASYELGRVFGKSLPAVGPIPLPRIAAVLGPERGPQGRC